MTLPPTPPPEPGADRPDRRRRAARRVGPTARWRQGVPAQRPRSDRLRRGVPAPARAPGRAHEAAGPRRAQGRPAERQARPVRRVRRLPRLHPRRRPAPARLERLRPPREAVRQAVRRGGGRHDHVPPRRQPVDGLRAARRSCCSPSGPRRPSATSRLAGEDRVVDGRAGRADGAAARRRCAARPRLPAPRQPVGDRSPRTGPRTCWPRPAMRRRDAHGRGRRRPASRTCSTRPRTGSSASSPRPARS